MFKVKKGSILIYRVFDIGDEIDLEKVKNKLNVFVKDNWTVKQSSRKSIIINNPPLSLQLNDEKIKIDNKDHDTKVFLKMWDYGVCSICFSIRFDDMTSDQLLNIHSSLEQNTAIDELAKSKVEVLFNNILTMIKKPKIWDIFEDYTLTLVESVCYLKPDQDAKAQVWVDFDSPKEFMSKYSSDLAHILVGESKEILSDSMQKDILSNTLQYSQKDLTVIDWNSAFIIEPSGSLDIPDLIEFVLTHQLEIRYYNSLLEYKKQILYKNAENRGAFLNFNDMFSNISVQASQRFLEFSDMIRKVDNSIETVGDFYLAKVIEMANYKFNSKIRAVLDANMSELQKEAESLSSKTQTKLGNFTGIAIIALILIELLIAYLKA